MKGSRCACGTWRPHFRRCKFAAKCIRRSIVLDREAPKPPKLNSPSITNHEKREGKSRAPQFFSSLLGRSPTEYNPLTMTKLTSVLNQLQQEHARLTSQLERVNGAISALNRASTNETGRRRISTAGRARISAAQPARWAKAKGSKVVSISVRKRTMSPAARRRIAAAQRARWARWRRARKKH